MACTRNRRGEFASEKLDWSLEMTPFRKRLGSALVFMVLVVVGSAAGDKYPAYSTLFTANVFADEIPVNLLPKEMRKPLIYEKQMEVVRFLSDKCEFQNKKAFPLTIDPKESGGYQVSMADFQWEVNSLIEDYRALNDEVLSYDEAIVLALDEERIAEVTRGAIFELGHLRRWTNCANAHGLWKKVADIKKLEE